MLQRGPYLIAAGLDESTTGEPPVLKGRYIDLFDSRLPVVDSVTVKPGARRLLLDLDRAGNASAAVLASACKVTDAHAESDGAFHCRATGAQGIEAVMRIRLPRNPASVEVDGLTAGATHHEWDAATSTLLLRFPNSAAGVRVSAR